MFRRLAISCLLAVLCAGAAWAQKGSARFEYKLLATNRTTTMEKEMNAVAADGYQFREVASGETSIGGNEALVSGACGKNL